MTKRKIITVQDLSSESGAFIQEMQSISNTSAALLAAAFIDASLDVLLRAFLVNDRKKVDALLGAQRALDSLGSRATLAFCLGLISQELYSDIDTIRKIRNEFAHSRLALGFGDQPINDWCKNLFLGNKCLASFIEQGRDVNSADIFIHTVSMIVTQIITRGLEQQHRAEGIPFKWIE